MVDYATNLDEKISAFQKTVTEEFITKTTAMREESDKAVKDSMEQVSEVLSGLESGIKGLNEVLASPGGQADRHPAGQAPLALVPTATEDPPLSWPSDARDTTRR